MTEVKTIQYFGLDHRLSSVPFLHTGLSIRRSRCQGNLARRVPRFVLLIGVLSLTGCVQPSLKPLWEVIHPPAEVVVQQTTPTPSEDTTKPSEEVESSVWHRNIIATYFDITQYPTPQTAWNDMDALSENPYYLALPFNDRVPGFGEYGPCKNRWVEIVEVSTGTRAFGQWEDVGPWFVNDVDYVFDKASTVRPFAEIHEREEWNIYRKRQGTGVRKPRTVLNGAGIDLSPLLAEALRIGGKGRVNWRFVEASAVSDGPWKQKVSTTAPHYRQRFYSFFGETYRPWELTTTRFRK
ncbi:MAG: hypothetical protein ABIH23_09505 [bacterium]